MRNRNGLMCTGVLKTRNSLYALINLKTLSILNAKNNNTKNARKSQIMKLLINWMEILQAEKSNKLKSQKPHFFWKKNLWIFIMSSTSKISNLSSSSPKNVENYVFFNNWLPMAPLDCKKNSSHVISIQFDRFKYKATIRNLYTSTTITPYTRILIILDKV